MSIASCTMAFAGKSNLSAGGGLSGGQKLMAMEMPQHLITLMKLKTTLNGTFNIKLIDCGNGKRCGHDPRHQREIE